MKISLWVAVGLAGAWMSGCTSRQEAPGDAAAIGPDAFVATSDGGSDAAARDAFAPDVGRDAFVARDAGMDAYRAPDAYHAPDAFRLPDAYSTTDAAIVPSSDSFVAIAWNAASTSSATVTLQLVPPDNLLAGGGFDDGTTTGWMETSGGDGWGTADTGTPPNVSSLFGASMIVGSYSPCQLVQTVDLIAAGISAADIDTRTTPLTVRQFYTGTGSQDDTYELIIEYLDASGAVLAMSDTGDLIAALSTWSTAGESDIRYPAGTRAVRMTITTTDHEFWAGHYAAALDGTVVSYGNWEVRLSNDGTTWSDWQPYAPTLPWTLGTATGAVTVTAQFRLVGTTDTFDATDTITRL